MTKRHNVAPAAKPPVVSNTVKGMTLHLGDGRKLAFGESAVVTAEVAAAIKAIHG